MVGRILDLDRSRPLLLVKVGRYPLQHGTVGAIRSVGRLGTPVYAIVEDRFTPAARSRYLTGSLCWPTTGREQAAELVEGLMRIGTSIGGRPIALATDDEAAVLLAEHAVPLRERFVLPSIPPRLARQLASKHELHTLCLEHGIPTAAAARPRSPAEVITVAESLGFPLVVKNDEPWLRLTQPGVSSTEIIRDRLGLQRLVDSWTSMPSVVVQEYLPRERAIDWIVHGYFGKQPNQQVIFTGRKLRSWPPHAGVTTYAYSCSNAELVELTSEFCRKVGYRGICDLDWRYDSVARQYKLLDFNPRLGAQFRLFENVDGVDVVRAMHLDLTGRELPSGRQVDGRRYIVENLDLPAVIAYRRSRERQAARFAHDQRELAWWASDDPIPALIAFVQSAAYASRKLLASRMRTAN